LNVWIFLVWTVVEWAAGLDLPFGVLDQRRRIETAEKQKLPLAWRLRQFG
jgi:hypothetical protein